MPHHDGLISDVCTTEVGIREENAQDLGSLTLNTYGVAQWHNKKNIHIMRVRNQLLIIFDGRLSGALERCS